MANALPGFVAIVEIEAAARAGGFPLENAFAEIAGADIAEGDKLEVGGIVLTDQNAAFIAGADEAGAHGPAAEGTIRVGEIARRRHGHGGPGRHQAAHELAARHSLAALAGRLG